MKKSFKGKYVEVTNYVVSEEYSDSRLDNFLISRLKGLPRSKIYSVIRKGEVRINGSRSKPKTRLKKDDVVRIPPYVITKKSSAQAGKSLIDLLRESILYHEHSILIINKPEGLASHGGSGLKLGLIEAVRQIDNSFINAQLVHRLDKDTSGCIVLALKRSVLRTLNKELREGRVKKKYLAVVKGQWPKEEKIITSKLKKNQLKSGDREVRISAEGKESKTKFKKLKGNKFLSLMECELLTGRTHQIRVQTSSEGYPIIGDKKYGDSDINKLYKQKGIKRMLLHAKSISFPEINLSCSANEPDIFNKIFNKI